MRVKQRLMRVQVLELRAREAGSDMGRVENVQGESINLPASAVINILLPNVNTSRWSKRPKRTLAILARKSDRTRNLNRSSSVWSTMRAKFALGSMFPVCVSTSSIYWNPSFRGLLISPCC